MPRTERGPSQSVNRKAQSEETDVAAEGFRSAREERSEKEGRTLRTELRKRGNGVLKGLDLPFVLEEDHGEIDLKIDVKKSFSLKDYEGFDLDALTGDPQFRIETRRIGSTGYMYVMTERVRDKNGHEFVTVRPDGQGAYPEKEDLRAAMMHDFVLGRKWAMQLRSVADACLIMAHYNSHSKEWLWHATEALLASSPDLDPSKAVEMCGMVIKDLVDAHRARMEAL